MSIPNSHRLFLLKLLVRSLMLGVVLSAVSCGVQGPGNDPDEEFYGYFLRDVDTMQQMGLPVYWLGRDFTIGESTFRGPYGVKFGGEVGSGGIRMGYHTWPEGTPFEGPTVELGLTVYGLEAWQAVADRLLDPTAPPPGFIKPTKQPTTVQGRQAELISVPGIGAPDPQARPVQLLRLIIQLDGVVVVAQADSGGPITPGGPDYNPFINDPDLLVQVMQDLRPYPE